MRRLLLLILPLACMGFVSADWVNVRLSEKVSVDFPAEPGKTEMGGNPIWTSDQQDAGFKCLAMVIDFSKFGLDSAMLAKELEGEKFYNDFQTSMLAQLEGATLISDEKIKVKGWPAYKLNIDLGSKNPKVNRLYCINIFVGNSMYSLSFYEDVKKPQETSKAKFFDSFKVN